MHEWDEDYGLPVLRGEIVVGELVYLAVERHYQDLRDGAKRGLTFSPGHAWKVIQFIERFFVHIKGPLAGRPILLDPWQKFWTAVLYGWLGPEGTRRFTRGYEEVARKNGKSTWKGPQGAYLFMADMEVGAEVYAVATTREQAMSVFKPAFDNIRRWARRSKGVKRSFTIHEGTNQEKVAFDSSVFKPLPANAESLDGLNPSAILFDELHAQKTPEVWDVMESALGARTQPLLSAITTAGFILDGVCTEIRRYLIEILRGEREDDSFFGYVYTLDADDDPFEERNWIKANPGLGMSKRFEYMRSMARKAKALPSALTNFLTKDLNQWVNGADGWIHAATYDKGGKPFDPAILRGRKCYGGLDLSSTRDLTALALVFPPDESDPDGEWYLLVYTYCPRAKVTDQAADDRADYKRWEKDGWLNVTEGNVTDYTPIKNFILGEVRERYELVELAFDKWNATHLANELMEAGVPMVEVPQMTGGMYPGAKKFEELIYDYRLRHGGNAVMRWATLNVSLLFDSNGNFRPDKKKSLARGRIDPAVATVMALSRASAGDGRPLSETIDEDDVLVM
ncbi:terminase [Pandoraea pneumonica]|uniref:Terminase n=1 Tax=Pandoraea pneumonica TaxID=2508299 RepID=A0A5E4WU35_9BURK|nr:terminase TerL endonuclease subunit [Pandoraea pneumonica]VVE28358.1 terminase [Pandoraea pneumonica]